MSDALETYRHSVAGFELPVPAGWERRGEGRGLRADRGRAAAQDEHLRATVVVRWSPCDEELDAWTLRSLAALADSLHHHRLLDVQPVTVGGREARRALSHYVNRLFGGVCVEQWLVPAGEMG